MAQDPYGFPETSSGTAPADATLALWLGVAAALLTSLGMCLMYMPYFIAAPMGGYAAYRGYRVVSGVAPGDPRDRTMATAGMVAGGASAVVSSLFILFFLLYLLFIVAYFVFIIAIIGVGAASSPPPPM